MLATGRVRTVDRFGGVADGEAPLGRVPGRHAVYFARPGWECVARVIWWVDAHKWDLDEWCYLHGLMWLEDGDWYANARWRFPWRRLPSLPQMVRAWRAAGVAS